MPTSPFQQLRDCMARILEWAEAAPIEEMEAAEAVARMNFPSPDLQAALASDDPYRVDGTVRTVLDWFASAGRPALSAIEGATGTPVPFRPVQLDSLSARALAFPLWEEAGEGCVRPVIPGAPDRGRRRFHSLGNAALEGVLRASVFDRPLRAEPVYDGVEALKAGMARAEDLQPVGIRACYKVVFAGGAFHHPPAWPADLAREEPCDEGAAFSP